MASVGMDGNGRRRILFVAGDGTRKTIRLGKVSQRQAESFKVKVESLIAQGITGSIDDEVSRWLAGLDDLMHARLAAVGLTKPRKSSGALALGPFIDAYIAGRSDIKPNTRIGLGQARRNLVAFFGENKPLGDITEGDAEEYRRYLLGKLSVNTARRLCGRAKQFFRFAVRKRMIRENPFTGLESNVRSNPARQFFVTRKMADAVIEACPDCQWRVIVALSRYGGVRCPSETLALTWADVEWDRNRIRVPSPKTEHIEGRASRFIPLFPELRGPLMEAFEAAAPGDEHVITRYRDGKQNLRTHFKRIISRAGLEPWPKLFHNLRSSRQTELAETFPAHVVCAWLGNTQAVAQAHYLQVTQAHFDRAAATSVATPDSAAQNPAQQAHEKGGNASQPVQTPNKNHSVFPSDSAPCEIVQDGGWPLSESNRYALAGIGF
jgi:integrase